MKMFFAWLCLFFVTYAHSATLFENQKEGPSYLVSKSEKSKISKITQKISANELFDLVEETLSNDELTGCSFDVIEELEREFESRFDRSFSRYDRGVYYFARENNQIDDVVLKILLNARDVLTQPTSRANKEDHFPSFNKSTEVFSAIEKWRESNESGKCLSYSWKKFIEDISLIHTRLTTDKINDWLKYAEQRGVIDRNELKTLQRANFAKLQEWPLTLAAYKGKKKYLLRHFPVEEIDRSSFISSEMPSESFILVRFFEEKFSYRERLYHNYSPKQIIYLSNFIKRLKDRINAMSVNINVLDYDGEILEVIELTPMEQYRFAAKMVRRELRDLERHTLFRGTNVNYLDLVSAAFEVGELQSAELEFISAVEELWNPKLSKREKMMSFARTYGPIGALLLPPGVQYVVPIALVVIEVMTKENKKDGAQDDYNLF